MHTPALSHEPLWTRARALFARAVAALGGPAAIAALAQLSAALRRRIVGWLAPLECVARKLLLAEAARLPAPGLQVRTPPRAAGAPAAVRSGPDLARPETWSARFRLAPPRDPHLVRDACAPRIRSLATSPFVTLASAAPPPLKRTHSQESAAFRFARRLEAVRRVLENPLPHARRLMRLIARARRAYPEIAMRFAMAPARAVSLDQADPRLVIDTTGVAIGGGFALADTS